MLTSLSWEVRFLWVTDDGDSRVCSIRFNPLFRLRPVFNSKIIAPNLEPLVFGTNSGSVNEPLMGGSFFCGERGGDRSIGEANLRKGRQPLQWKRHCRPLLWKRHCRPLQWKRPCRPLLWKRCCRPLQWKRCCRPLQWKWRCRSLQWKWRCRPLNGIGTAAWRALHLFAS